MWEIVGGYNGHYRHTKHPAWKIHVICGDDLKTRMFWLTNEDRSYIHQFSDLLTRGGLYVVLDVANAYIQHVEATR